MIGDGLKLTAKPVDVWLDAGLPETVLSTNAALLESGADVSDIYEPGNGVKIVPPVYIHPSAEVTASVIGPNTSIGPGCRVSYSKIENSVAEEGAVIETSQLRDSLIGARAQVTGARGKLDIGDDTVVEDCG